MQKIFAILLLSCSVLAVNEQQPVNKTDAAKAITYRSIMISNASKNIGNNVRISGTVSAVKTVGEKVLVDVSEKNTNQLITVILTGNPTSLANKIPGKEISFLGTMLMLKGKPQMEVKSFSQVIYNFKQ